MRDATPPQPAAQLSGVATLDLIPSRTVACVAFSDPTTEPIVRGYHAFLSKQLKSDGLESSDGEPEEQFRLAQFDALFASRTRVGDVGWQQSDTDVRTLSELLVDQIEFANVSKSVVNFVCCLVGDCIV